MKKVVIVLGALIILILLGLNCLKLSDVLYKERFRPPTPDELKREIFIEAMFVFPEGVKKEFVEEVSLKGATLKLYRIPALKIVAYLDDEVFEIDPMVLENNYFGARLRPKMPTSNYHLLKQISFTLAGVAQVNIRNIPIGEGKINLGKIKFE